MLYLQVDGLRKVFEIFKSDSVDPGVKKSAVDQLAIILQGWLKKNSMVFGFYFMKMKYKYNLHV